MIGKKMALAQLAMKVWHAHQNHIPETEEEDTKENRQKTDTHGLGLLKDLDQTVCERGNPKEPFEQSSKHDTANDGDIDNLFLLATSLKCR
jgi:hypothetical protein